MTPPALAVPHTMRPKGDPPSSYILVSFHNYTQTSEALIQNAFSRALSRRESLPSSSSSSRKENTFNVEAKFEVGISKRERRPGVRYESEAAREKRK